MQYSVVAKKALSKFNRQMSSWREHRAKPVDLKRKYEEDIPTVSIYHADTGMLPHYAGHVQGTWIKSDTVYYYLMSLTQHQKAAPPSNTLKAAFRPTPVRV